MTNNGNVTLGGVLNLSLLDGFNPPLGQVIPLFEGAIGSITGQFSAVNAPFFNGHTLNVVYGVNQVTLQVGDANFLAADFDENGAVNGADLLRWRTNFGTAPRMRRATPTATGTSTAPISSSGSGNLAGSRASRRRQPCPNPPALRWRRWGSYRRRGARGWRGEAGFGLECTIRGLTAQSRLGLRAAVARP